DIEIWRRPSKHDRIIADCKGFTTLSPGNQHGLKSDGKVAWIFRTECAEIRTRKWLGLQKQLQSAGGREFHHLIETPLVGQIGGVFRNQDACLKLQVADRGKRGRRGNRRTAGI